MKITPQMIIDWEPCKDYTEERIFKLFGEKESATTLEILEFNDIPLKDRAWILFHNEIITLEKRIKLAVELAWIVLPIYETEYPDDKRPRKALEAADADADADAAYAAIYAAYVADIDAAAYAAAYAAVYAAIYAAYVAVYAAYAAVYAAVYAAYAAEKSKDPKYKQQIIDKIKLYLKNVESKQVKTQE